MNTQSYFDFAENDYQYLMAAVHDGNAEGNLTCVISQNICEKYLKDLIDRFNQPQTEEQEKQKISIMRTHSLRKLENYLTEEMDITIPDAIGDRIAQADGYYFSARYPGDESFFVNQHDIEKCLDAVETARSFCTQLAYERLAPDTAKDMSLDQRLKNAQIKAQQLNEKRKADQSDPLSGTSENQRSR